MSFLARLLRPKELEEELARVRDRLDESDDRLDEARSLTKDAARRLELIEARVRLHRQTVA